MTYRGWVCHSCKSSYGADEDCIEEFGCLLCGARMNRDKPRHMRTCADCGYKDNSIIPPTKCPRCHNQPKNPLNMQALEARPMNRKERRRQNAERRLMERKVNKQIARENPSGKYEAS